MTGALNWATAVTVASATTTDIGAAASNYVIVSGTTTITGLGTKAQGAERIVRFSGALLLTHNSSSLILPGAGNITTVAGDVAVFMSEGSGNWRCASYQRTAGAPVLTGTSGTVLTGNGAGVPSTMQAPAVLFSTLLATLTASSSASVVDTTSLTTTYDAYILAFEGLTPATDAVAIRLRYSVDGGSSYIATGYTNDDGSSNAYVAIATGVANAGTAVGGVNGHVVINRIQSGKCTTSGQISAVTSATSNAKARTVAANNSSTTTVNALEFSASSGNLATGKIRIYGVRTT